MLNSPPIQKALSRTYARAIAGVPISMAFDYTSGSFYLEYSINLSARGGTEIFLPKTFYYPRGYTVSIAPDGWARSTEQQQNLLIITHTSNAIEGQPLTVTIRSL